MQPWGVFNSTRAQWVAQHVRVADSHRARLIGLVATPAVQFRPGDGLWIRPCHGVHTLGMRYSLDLIYLDGEGRVLRLVRNARPWRFFPVDLRTESVLELPAGMLALIAVEPGDHLRLQAMDARSVQNDSNVSRSGLKRARESGFTPRPKRT